MSTQTKKPIIFLAFANVRDDTVPYLRNLPEEQRQVRVALERARVAGLCEIVERSNATIAEILDVFQLPEYRNRIAIFHYGGHANGFQLLLESPEGRSSPAHAGGFAEFLAQQHGLQVVFLNGCSTQPQVQGLLQANVSAVIATSQAIADDIATNLATRFYTGLAGGASIGTAYNEAVASIKTEIGEDLLKYYLEATGGEENRWPWDIFINEGAEITDQWNLPDAADDPLFGLPALPSGDLPAKPYRHLHWFDREHAEVFFGREYQIRELYDRVTSPYAAPIILVYGQSGVGKSSILAAGLTPRLETSHEIRYQRIKKELDLFENLKNVIYPATPEAWHELENQLNKPVLIILDQVEEVFTRFDLAQPFENPLFFETLNKLFLDRSRRPGGKLILGFRKEWLAEIEKRFKKNKLPINLVFLERMDRRGLVEAIAGLTKNKRLQDQYGLSLENGLAEIIADDLMEDPESPLAPTLQILMTKMWNRTRRRKYSQPQFDISLYQKLKKQGILLRDFLNQQFERLHRWRPEVVESGLALDVLAFHTTPLGTAEQRSRRQLRETYIHQQHILPALIHKLKDLYLLVDPAKDRIGRASGRATRLAHDTLAPIIRETYEKSDKPGQRAARILATKRVDYDKKETETWLDEADLSTVETGLAGMRKLDEREQKLIETSRNKKAQNQKIRQARWAIGILMVMFIVLAALMAWINMNKARNQEKIARMRSLTISANDAFKTDTMKALRIAQAAYNLAAPDPPVYLQQLMHKIFYSQPESTYFARRFHHDALVSSAVFSPDGRKILTSSWDRTAKLWTVDGESLAVFYHNGPVTSTNFSPDGSRILTAAADSAVKLWSIDGDSLVIFKHRDHVYSAVFSPDGNKILTASADSTAKLWSIDGKSLVVFQHRNQVYSAVFSPDGKKILIASFNKIARLWSLDGDFLAIFRHNDRVYSAEFSPDGKNVLTASWDKTAKLWTLDGDSLSIFEHNNQLLCAAFSPGGNKMLTVCNNNTAKLWTVTGDSIGSFKHTHKIYSAVFSPDSKLILVATGDKTAKIWLTPGGIFEWLQTAPIPQLSKKEKREYGIFE